jgi:aminoglycoside phosphotransferase (APT) family kinase protein
LRAERHIPVPKDLLMEKDDSVILTKTQVMEAVKSGKTRETQNDDDMTADYSGHYYGIRE